MQRHYHLHFDYSPQLPRVARKALETLLLHSPLELEERNRVLLAISELTANLIRHSPQKPGKVQIVCNWCDRCFELKLVDDGSAMEEDAIPAELEDLLELDIQSSGYGLAMLQHSFDKISYQTLNTGLNQWQLQLERHRGLSEKHILLVDDDGIQLQMLQLYLEPHQCTAFHSPLEAIDWLKHNQPDLIISDIRMPEMDGLSFRQRVAELPHLHLTPFIFLTGDDDDTLADHSAKKDIDDFVLKPISKERIKQISDRVLNRSQALLKRTHALIDHELKHHLRKEITNSPDSLYQIASLSFSAHLGGGDYWLVDNNDQNLQIILADVMGHDIEACFMAGRQQGFFQALKDEAESINLNQVTKLDSNNELYPSDAQPPSIGLSPDIGSRYLSKFSHWLDHYQPELLTTLQMLIADQNTLYFYNAGSPPPWLLTQEGNIASLPQTGTLPGLFGDCDFPPFQLELQAGERLLLFSDGLIEAGHTDQAQWHRTQQLQELFNNHQLLTLDELSQQLRQLIEQDPIEDDISVILLEKKH